MKEYDSWYGPVQKQVDMNFEVLLSKFKQMKMEAILNELFYVKFCFISGCCRWHKRDAFVQWIIF
jgi:hypothetical protein